MINTDCTLRLTVPNLPTLPPSIDADTQSNSTPECPSRFQQVDDENDNDGKNVRVEI